MEWKGRGQCKRKRDHKGVSNRSFPVNGRTSKNLESTVSQQLHLKSSQQDSGFLQVDS